MLKENLHFDRREALVAINDTGEKSLKLLMLAGSSHIVKSQFNAFP